MSIPAVRITVLDDCELVNRGLEEFSSEFTDRIWFVRHQPSSPPTVDIALVDPMAYGAPLSVEEVRRRTRATHVAVYSWETGPLMVTGSLQAGAAAFIGKGSPADQVVAGLEKVYAGEPFVVIGGSEPQRWLGHREGLSVRQSAVVALITQGLSNDDIARRLFVSLNTVKSYIRAAYRRMDVGTRAEAVLWGVDHGFRTSLAAAVS